MALWVMDAIGTTPQTVPSIASEFEHADLGDARLTARLRKIADKLSRAPGKSFPEALGVESELDAHYRFLSNPRFTYAAVMESHIRKTCERVAAAGTVLCVEDTTECAFGGSARRRGLGRLEGKAQGFLAHCALAVAADGSRRPLGVLGLRPWVREGPRRSRKANGSKKTGSDYAKETDKESARWGELVEEIAARVGDRAALIHVMDREADAYPLLAQMVEGGHRFVVRLSKDRRVETEAGCEEWQRLQEVLPNAPDIYEVEVPVSKRGAKKPPGAAKTFAARESRVARLRFSAQRLHFKRPRYLDGLPSSLPIHVVHVHEVEVPEGVEPIEWTLATTEPIATAEDVLAVVRHYRARWTIEEFFKALKTGCSLEERQLESYGALLKALAIFLPVAWQLLLLRNLGRSAPDEPATAALSERQVVVLRAFTTRPLDERPTVRQAMFAVAALGGHLKRNGDPGWLTLARGLERLLTLELGWAAAQQPRSGPRARPRGEV